MVRYKVIFVFFTLLCMLACQSQKSEVGDSSIQIDWDNVSFGDFSIENVEYIPLETTDSSLLGSVSKVLFRNNRFYVLDKMSGGVYVFDRMGNFLSSIVKPGEGPEEYIELMDMDVDKEGNVYIADNARMVVKKYRYPECTHDKTFDIGMHYWEFSCLGEDCFLLKDVFGKEGMEMKLAHFDGKSHKVTPLIEKAFSSVNEMDVMKCSRFNFYRSGEKLYYYERFTPNIYSVSSEGKLTKVYELVSSNYIPKEDLEGLQREPMKFLKERRYIKDVIGLFESQEYFICAPIISPSGVCLVVPKNDMSDAIRIDLTQKPEFLGASLVEGVVEGKFFSMLNTPNEVALEYDGRLKEIGENANPVLMLFSIKVKRDE